MAELDQTTDTGTAEVTPTPLDSILDTPAADVPAQEQGGEAELGGLDAPQVPLKALKRERERRQKADRQVEELRLELERFDNQKFGWNETVTEEQQRLDREQAAADDPFGAAVANYNASFASFSSKHGPEAVAKVDAALSLTQDASSQAVIIRLSVDALGGRLHV